MPTTTTGKATDFITFSRGTLATVTDSDGKIKWAPHNLLTNSESFDASAWTKTTTTVAANSHAAPNNTTTAETLTASSANGTTLQSYTSLGVAYTFGVWLKRKTGTGNIQIAADSGTYSTVTITSDWALYTVTQTPAAGSISAGIRIVTSGDEVYAWGAHLYRSDLGGMQANASAYPMYNPTTPKNLLGYSEDFSNAAWAKTNASVTANAITAPNGLQGADAIYDSSATGFHYIRQDSIGVTSGTSYVFSVYAKANGRGFIALFDPGASGGSKGRYFSIPSDGSGSALGILNGTPTASSITHLGDGWYRCSITVSAGGSTMSPRVYISDTGSNISYTGDTSKGIYLWGAQLSDSASLDAYSPVFGAAPSAAAYHGPRLDYDPVTLSAKGLLVEEQRTNLALYSERFEVSHSLAVSGLSGTFQNGETVTATGGGSGTYLSTGSSASVILVAAGSGTFTGTLTGGTSGATATISNANTIWLPGNSGSTNPVVTANQATAPDGTSSADKVDFGEIDAANDYSVFALVFTASASPYAGSVYVKAASAGDVGKKIWAYTYDTAVKGIVSVTLTTSWQRLVSVGTLTSGINRSLNIGVAGSTTGGENQAAVSVHMWAGQLEAGAFATSYIPTAAATVTRNADVASVGVSQFPYSASEGTLVASGSYVGFNSSVSPAFSSITDGSTSVAPSVSWVVLYQTSTTMSALRRSNSTNATAIDVTNAQTANEVRKVGVAFAVGGTDGLSVNGGAVATQAGVASSYANTILRIGAWSSNPGYLNGHIRQITYLPRRISNAELQTRTA